MTQFSSMLTAALYAMLVQNIIFSTGYGMSESIRMAKRPKHFFMYGGTVTFFSLALSLICFFLNRIPFVFALETKYRIALYTLILTVLYLMTALFCLTVLKADKKFMNSLGMCALNTLIIALPVVNFKAGYTLAETVGTGIGAGLAFVLSVLLINTGMKHIQANRYIPEIFRGTPALFIYISLIALAMSCISGQSLFV
ncbi:MAG: hypothetical protein IJN88_05575 [Clostridia bacterium]|nr:hypothetical protein [Clostridia bacterium]